jgi:anti-sigma regulatory factor (Ser/Thr protein kinase)/CheY-like chemotaxis protein
VRAANVDLERTNSALAKALAAKTEFLATTSHEIRTPLNGILGMTQVMLSDRKLDESVRDRLGVVHGAGVTMKALVDDILDVAKMETGNLTIEAAPVDLPALLRDLCRLWDEQARGKGLVFTLDHADAAGWIEGDAARLRQILFNLLSNAVKFTDRGEVKLAASVEGDRLRLRVEDSGIGIDPDKQEVIFESFRQADSGTTRRFGGTGLGLAICRNLARAMGGDILVDSVPGQGSAFTLELPHRPITAPGTATEVGPGDALLIVDANPITRSMLKALFAGKAPALLFAASLDESAAAVRQGGISRVLIDEATARRSGNDLIEQLRAYEGVETFLLWTGSDSDLQQSAGDIGVRVVEKPISGAALVARVVGNDDTPPAALVTKAA